MVTNTVNRAESTINKMDGLLQPLPRNIVGQGKTTVNMQQFMDERKILLVKLSAQLDQITSLVGSLIMAFIKETSQLLPYKPAAIDTDGVQRALYQMWIAPEHSRAYKQALQVIDTNVKIIIRGYRIGYSIGEDLEEIENIRNGHVRLGATILIQPPHQPAYYYNGPSFVDR